MRAGRDRPVRLWLPVWLVLSGPAQAAETAPAPATESSAELLEFLGALEAGSWQQWTEFFDSLPDGLETLPDPGEPGGQHEGESS